ncbi:MAG: glycosyltransferase [Planctomycetota bacterium]
MRITYLVHQFLPNYFTGTEQYCYAIAQAMQERGHDVEVLALEPDFSETEPFFESTRETIEGLPVQRLRTWMHLDRDFERMEWSHPFLTEQVRRHLEARRPDVVHAFHLRYLGAPILDVARSLGARVFLHLMDFWLLCPQVTLRRADGELCEGPPENGLGCMDCVRPGLRRELSFDRTGDELARLASIWPADAEVPPGRVGRALGLVSRPKELRRAVLANATKIWAPSAFLKQAFVQNGWPESRIDVLRYGVDPARVGDAADRHTPARKLRCAFVGSLSEHKGTQVAVDAVLAAGPEVELTLHGRETDFPDYSRALRQRIGDDPRVRFAGPFERDRLSDVLATTDLLIAPSLWYENTPFVVLEAQMARVPVAVSDLGGMSEIVQDGTNGLVFPAGDSASLAERLRGLVADRNQLSGLREAAPMVKTLQANVSEIEAAQLATLN